MTANPPTLPRYMPYADGSRAFSIGLRPLALPHWIEPDANLARDLGEKARLWREGGEAVFQAEPASLEAQREVLDLLLAHLGRYFPDLYELCGQAVRLRPTETDFRLADWEGAPLALAGQLVQEDFCLLQRAGTGWRLAAASVSFPSYWRLSDKAGRSLEEIHAPVPGYRDRMGPRVTRIFDHLRAESPVWRLNWSLHDTSTLRLPGPSAHPRFAGLAVEAVTASAFVRVERQTLRRLPRTGAVLFTIKTYVDPLGALLGVPEARTALKALIGAIEGLTPEELAYKGLSDARDKLLAALNARLAS